MKQKNTKIARLIKKYPVLIGIALVIFVMGFILFIKLYERWNVIDLITTENMERESSVDGFTAGSDTVRYLLSALQEGDLDKAIRAFPIDEMALGINVAKIIDTEVEKLNLSWLPSAEYAQYFPVTSSELAGEFAKVIASLSAEIDWHKTEILNVQLLSFDYQQTEQYQQATTDLRECWNAEEICEMAAEIRYEDKIYMMPVTLIKYNEKWKVLQINTVISDDIGEGLTEIDQNSYNSLTEAEAEETLYTENPEQQMLPPNYFIAGQVFSDSPEKAIREFSRYLEKEDITSALSYMDLQYEQNDDNLEKILNCQKEAGEEIAKLYYGILLEGRTEGGKELDELDMAGSEIVERLNPQNIPYMNLQKIVDLGEDEYAVVYFYERKCFLVGFTMNESDEGWQIKSLTANSLGLEDGGAKLITVEEYERLGEE